MKILLINQTFYPDNAATAQRLTDFALALTQAGHQVTVLTGRCPYASSGSVYPVKETYEGIRIVRVWPFSFSKKSKCLRILGGLLVNLVFAWKMLWMKDFNAVVALTTPPLVGWVAAHFASWRKQKFFYWIMDLNPDQVIEAGWIKRDSFLARFLEGRLKSILKRSERIIVLDRYMKQRIVDKGIGSDKIEICSIWADETGWEQIPHDKNPFRAQHDLAGKFVVMYSGNHSHCHPLTTLLDAARELKEDPSVVFLFVGGGNAVQEVLDFKNAHELANIKYLPYQPLAALKYSLAAADLQVVTMGAPYVGVVHPCKIYNMLAVGKPILYIGPKGSHITDVLQTTKVGDRVEHGDVMGAVNVILKAKKMSDAECDRIVHQSNEAVRTLYSQAQAMKRLLSIIEG